MGVIHLLGISSDKKFVDRLQEIASDFEFNSVFFDSCEKLSDEAEPIQALTNVLSAINNDSTTEISGQLQVLKYNASESFTILVINKKFTPENALLMKKSGADMIINESDFFETSFLEYILSQMIRGSLLPIKGMDLKSNSVVNFKVLSVLPLNKKIVPVVQENEVLQGNKFEKIKNSKELYISRDNIQKVQEYIKKNKDPSAEGVASRCRINYLNLCKAHADLIFNLFDRSDQVTFSYGKALLEKCTAIASEMLMNLSTLEDPWSIINNSTLGETGSVERSPAIAAMAGLMTVNLKDIQTNESILAGLLCDIGMISLHPKVLKKIRNNQINELTPEELLQYQNHPLRSVDKCLEKKLPLNERIKTIMVATHERFDKKGFPNKISPSIIPKESQLLQYCEFIDQKLLIKMGQENLSASKVQMDTLEEELVSKKILDVTLTFELKKYLSIVETTKKPETKP